MIKSLLLSGISVVFLIITLSVPEARAQDGMLLRTVAEFPYCPELSDMKTLVRLAEKGDKAAATKIQLQRCGVLDVGRTVKLIKAVPDEENKGISYVKVQYVDQKQDPFWTLANAVDFQ